MEADQGLPESEGVARVARFEASPAGWARLVRTLVAMANSSGGRVLIEDAGSERVELEAARLLARVNALVGPPLRNLTAAPAGTGIEIGVGASITKPHVFRSALPEGDGAPAVHAGQVWVRHGAKDAPAAPEDLERLMRDRLAALLDELRVLVQAEAPHFMSEGMGMPVRFSDEPGAVPVVPDVDRAYPYSAKTLGAVLGKSQNWAAAAVDCLDFRGQPEYWFATRGTSGFAVQRYSERAAERLRAKLREVPDWNPYAELRAKGRRTARRRRPLR